MGLFKLYIYSSYTNVYFLKLKFCILFAKFIYLNSDLWFELTFKMHSQFNFWMPHNPVLSWRNKMLIYLMIIFMSYFYCIIFLMNLPDRMMSKENMPVVIHIVLTCRLKIHRNDQFLNPPKHETILTHNMTNIIVSINYWLPGRFVFFAGGMTITKSVDLLE